MNKLTQTMLGVLLCVAMVVALMPATAAAAGEPVASDLPPITGLALIPLGCCSTPIDCPLPTPGEKGFEDCHRINKFWLIPIKASVIAALKAAGVKVTWTSMYVGGRLWLAWVSITRASVTAGKALRAAGVAIRRATVEAAQALQRAGVRVCRRTVEAARALDRARVQVYRRTVEAAEVLIQAGQRVTRSSVDRLVRAKPIIRRALIAAGITVTAEVLRVARWDWIRGVCIIPWCTRPARSTRSWNPARMVCEHCP